MSLHAKPNFIEVLFALILNAPFLLNLLVASFVATDTCLSYLQYGKTARMAPA